MKKTTRAIIFYLALLLLGWLLFNGWRGGINPTAAWWLFPCLMGLAILVGIVWLGSLVGPRPQDEKPPPPPQTAGHPTGEPTAASQTQHQQHPQEHRQELPEWVWEFLWDLLKELLHGEKKEGEEEKEVHHGFDWGTFLVYAGLIAGLIFLADQYGLLGKNSATFFIWDKVVPKNGEVRGYGSLEAAQEGRLIGSAKDFKVVLQIKEQSDGQLFSRACSNIDIETTCWWFRTDQLEAPPAPTPVPTPGPTKTPQRAEAES